MEKAQKTRAIILLLILIAIGGLVLYGRATPPSQTLHTTTVPPSIEGPHTPPPGYAVPR